ncbi:MAG: hypothetical protein R3B47_07275 [Bacteroidia bacterium]
MLASLQYDQEQGVTTPRPLRYRFPDDGSCDLAAAATIKPAHRRTWNVPPKLGVYNVAFRVEEFRQGISLGYVIRDMVILNQKLR